jgi:hypothetical protein
MLVTVLPHTLHWAKPMGSLSYMLKCPDLCGVYDPGKEEKKIYMVNFYNFMSIQKFHDDKTCTTMSAHLKCNYIKVH